MLNKTAHSYRNVFIIALFVHFIVWTLLPVLLLKNTYYDILEQLFWARHLSWGYDKDPFLGTLLVKAAVPLGGVNAVYALSQLAIVASFIAVWQLAKAMLAPRHALVAVLLLEAISFYNLSSPEFNDNVLMIPLWAWTIYAFYQAMQTERLYFWLLTGLFAGLAMMAKYYTGMLLLGMFCFSLFNTKARQAYRQPGVYCAVVLLVIICLPNFLWLVSHHFITFHYALARGRVGQDEGSWLAHITNPWHFFINMLLQLVVPFLILLLAARRDKDKRYLTFDKQFITFMLFSPIVLTSLFSVVTGSYLRQMWGTPLFNLVGVWLVLFYRPMLQVGRYFRRCLIAVTIVFCCLSVTYVFRVSVNFYLKNRGDYEIMGGHVLGKEITALWHAQVHAPLRYVAGPRVITMNAAYYAKDKPDVYFEWEPAFSFWINEKQLRKAGAIFVWQAPKGSHTFPPGIKARFPRAQFLKQITLPWEKSVFAPVNRRYVIAPSYVNVALLPPEA